MQDKLDSETRKKVELESKLKTKGHELEEAQKRQEKLVEHIRQVANVQGAPDFRLRRIARYT